MFNDTEKQLIQQYLNNTEGKVYIGCDSQKITSTNARYTVVLIIHINNSEGCKMFGYTETERVYDQSSKKPRLRLMTEVYKAVGLYLEFAEFLESKDVEIHLDINADKNHISNMVFNEAAGYVLGVCGFRPKMKPYSWAASHCADHVVRGKLKSGIDLNYR